MTNWKVRLMQAGTSMMSFSVLVAVFFIMASPEGNIMAGFVSMTSLVLGVMAIHASLLNPAASLSLQAIIQHYLRINLSIIFSKIIYKKVLAAMKDPQKHQDEVLMQILVENGKTAFGEDHGLYKIKSRQEFVKTFPLTKFDTYEKYVERIRNGESNVMTKAKVLQLCATSGTTGKNKMYPITNADYLKFVQYGLTVIHTLNQAHKPDLRRELDVRMYHPVTETKGGLKVMGIGLLRGDQKATHTCPSLLTKITKEGPSYFVQALFSLRDPDVSFIMGVSSDLMYSFFKSMEFNKDAICRAIATGHINSFPGLDDEVRQELNQMLSPDQERAKKVKQELEKGSDAFARRVWPDLQTVFVGKTGGFAHSARIMEKTYLKNVKFFFGVHGATEGLFGVPMSVEDQARDEITFMPGNMFLEFIKEEEMEDVNPKTFLLSELEIGQSYELVVTNWYGLYRNRFGDVIKVVGYTENTPKYTFQYRTGQILNCAYDRTPEKIFYDALKMAETEWKIEIGNYTSTESMQLETANGEKSRKNHYVTFIETLQDVKLTDIHSSVLEKKLCDLQQTYAEYREQESLGPVEIIQVPRGTFDGLRNILWGDKPSNQFKTPRVLRNHNALLFLWNNRLNN